MRLGDRVEQGIRYGAKRRHITGLTREFGRQGLRQRRTGRGELLHQLGAFQVAILADHDGRLEPGEGDQGGEWNDGEAEKEGSDGESGHAGGVGATEAGDHEGSPGQSWPQANADLLRRA